MKKWVAFCFCLAFGFTALPLAGADTLVVSNTADSGPGSLRQALLDGNSGDTIQFASGLSGTITLQSGLDQAVALTWIGPGASALQINGSQLPALTPILSLQPGASGTAISGLAFNAGIQDAIFTQADLNLSQVTVSGNAGLGLNVETAQVTVENSLISGNQNGGIFAEINSELILVDSTLSDNQRSGDGGGIALNGSLADLSATTLSGNGSQAAGGGIALTNSDLTAENVTFSANTAVGDGGGLFADASSTVSLSSVTLTLNEAATGGGLVSLGGADLLNTLVAQNMAGASPDCSGTLDSLGGNFLGNNSGCTLNNAMADDQQGTNASPLNPQLAQLADAGGPVMTHVPLQGSPVVDAGTNANCPGTDARGTTRPLNGLGNGATPLCDVGAAEAGRCQLQFSAQGFANLKLQSLNPLLPTTVSGQLMNLGPDFAPGVTIAGILPDGVQLLGVNVGSGTCSINGASFNCSLGNLAVDGVVDFTLQIQVTSDTPATYLIQAQAGTSGEDLGDQNTLKALLSVGAPEQDSGGGCQLDGRADTPEGFWLFGMLGGFGILVRYWTSKKPA